jgi:hypothetical protein
MSTRAKIWSKGTAAMSLLWLLMCATMFSNAGFKVLNIFVIMAFAGIWGVAWLIRLGTYQWRIRRRTSPQVRHQQRSLAYWVAEPATALLVLGLAWSGAFFHIRFAISEPLLSRYVERVRAGKVNLAFEFHHPPRLVGLYVVSITDLLPDGTVRFITSGDGVMNRAGFAFSANSPPPRQGEDSYKHIRGQWWIWSESW